MNMELQYCNAVLCNSPKSCANILQDLKWMYTYQEIKGELELLKYIYKLPLWWRLGTHWQQSITNIFLLRLTRPTRWMKIEDLFLVDIHITFYKTSFRSMHHHFTIYWAPKMHYIQYSIYHLSWYTFANVFWIN